MIIHEANNDADIVDQLIEMVEEQSGKKIFTMRVMEQTQKGLETIVVFEDKTILMALIKVQGIGGKLALRMKGNFI